MLDEVGLSYINRGIDADGDEYIVTGYSGEKHKYHIHCYFEKDQEHTAIFVWYLIEYDTADELAVMKICNMLNARYLYTCFYADTSDNTVTCSMNLIYRDDNVGIINTLALGYMVRVINEAIPVLQDYAK